MAFTGNYMCDSFLEGLMTGAFNFGVGTADVYKLALYTNTVSLNAATVEYSTDGEVIAAGYAAGGNVVTPTQGFDGGVSFISFGNTSWNAALTARGALLYKDGGGAVCVLDFGSDKTSNTVFNVGFPPSSRAEALIRLS
jgi:hypothetical protein